MKKILFFWRELLATFWFLPVLIICLAIILSIGLVSLDNALTLPQDGWLRYFLVNSPDSARSLLTTISGAMIGVAGTVFSVTLVALTLASSQFGPRLIKNFMYVRLNQVVLGSYIATFVYCLLVLNSVKASSDHQFIPTISILVASVAAIANIILLIIFIHRTAVSIQADQVVADISDVIARQIEDLFPEAMGEEHEADRVDLKSISQAYGQKKVIRAPKSGYLQYISGEALIDITSKEEVLLILDHRPGSYLVKDMAIGEVYFHKEWSDELTERITKQLVIGKTKTAQQDLEFSIHQLVEIAARALSPGVNDPYTAIACIDNLKSTMCYLAQAKFPSRYRFDEDGNLRVCADALDFEGVLDAAFNQIRQFAAGNPAVLIRLMEALIIIQEFTKDEQHHIAVIKHAQMVMNCGQESISEKNDLEDLKTRASKLL